MVKKSSDEPDDKALERLRQFEQSRKPVPAHEDDKKKKGKKTGGKQKGGKQKEKDDNEPDTATDKLKV